MSFPRHGSPLAILIIFLAGLVLVATASAQPPLPTVDNLLGNPGFEGGLAGWSYTSGQASAASSPVHSGGGSARLTNSAGGWVEIVQVVPVTPLATYSAGGYFYLDSQQAQTPQMRIEWRDAAGQSLGTSPQPACSGASWQLCTSTQPAPTTAAFAAVKARVYIRSAGGLAYVDDASFTQTAPPPTPTLTSTPSPTVAPATASATDSPTTPPATATPSSTMPPATAIATPTPTSPAPVQTCTPTRSQTPARTATATATAPTRTPTLSQTPARTATATATAPTRTPTRSQTRAPTASATATLTVAPTARICINEVEYWSNHTDTESYYEWFELYNSSGMTATLTGWTISDNLSTDTIPDVRLAPGGFVVVAARTANFRENYPWYSGPIVELGQPIGNGLANSGDRLILRDHTGRTVDALSYGDNTSVFTPAIPTVASMGVSLERRPAGRDTDGAGDFQPHDQPSPGQGWDEATPAPTSTPTTTETVTPAPTSTVTQTATQTMTQTPTTTATTQPGETPAATVTATATVQAVVTESPEPTPTLTTTVLPTTPATATVTLSPTG